MYQPKRWRAERGARRAFLGIMLDGPKGRAAGCFFAYSRPRPNCQEGTPPAGRAPPCTRWGESLPPDPGATSRRRSVPKRCAFSARLASGPPVGVGWFPVEGMFVRIVLGGVDRAGRQRNASGGQGAALHPLGGEPPPRPRRNVPEALRTETLRFFGPDRLRAALSAWDGSPLKGCSFGSLLAASTVRDEQAVF